MIPDIQTVIDVRVASVADDYMDNTALAKLRTDLHEDVGTSIVETHVGADNILRVVAVVGPERYESEVQLTKRVVRMVPGTFQNDLPEDERKANAEKHGAAMQAKAEDDADKAHQAQAEAQQDDQHHDDEHHD